MDPPPDLSGINPAVAPFRDIHRISRGADQFATIAGERNPTQMCDRCLWAGAHIRSVLYCGRGILIYPRCRSEIAIHSRVSMYPTNSIDIRLLLSVLTEVDLRDMSGEATCDPNMTFAAFKFASFTVNANNSLLFPSTPTSFE